MPMTIRRVIQLFPALLLAVTCACWAPAVAQAATSAPGSHLAATSSALTGRGGSSVRPQDAWWQCGPGNGGSQCDQTDPYDTGCASSKIYVASGNVWRGNAQWQVQLYYSTACGTVWSRLQLLRGSNSCFDCILSVIRSNFNSSDYTSSDVGSDGGTIYSGSWTNQLYLPCGGSLSAHSELWNFITPPYGESNNWYPGC